MTDKFAENKELATSWFRDLRDKICAEFESLEREAPVNLYPGEPGKFEYEDWLRKVENGGGGTGGMMRGRLFEKCGVHISVVKGEFTPEMAARTPGADKDPHFWAAGISLIAHMRNPRTQNTKDAKAFHAGMEAACSPHHVADYPRFKDWCDEYFHLKHRDEPRGIGGIFYDRHNSGDWSADFAFTQDVGRHFLSTYSKIVRRRMSEPWSDEEREEQLITRGRYVEFNLLWDRGTTFGLKTGGNVKTILSSMPPVVKWP